MSDYKERQEKQVGELISLMLEKLRQEIIILQLQRVRKTLAKVERLLLKSIRFIFTKKTLKTSWRCLTNLPTSSLSRKERM